MSVVAVERAAASVDPLFSCNARQESAPVCAVAVQPATASGDSLLRGLGASSSDPLDLRRAEAARHRLPALPTDPHLQRVLVRPGPGGGRHGLHR